jgi:membrane-bound serine protease (ClpP class)
MRCATRLSPLLHRWLVFALLAIGIVLAQDTPRTVPLLRVDGAIGPATADYIARGIKRAARDGAPLVVLVLDTPGGLDSSTRTIVKDILASPVPVATYVFPSGARAASAGTYIAQASHVAAMAPGTNLGAATPVQIGGGGMPGGSPRSPDKPASEAAPKAPEGDAMTRKVVNDSAAWLRSLAQLRGRNVDWAERAVREGASLSAAEANEQKVVDFIAADPQALLGMADGRTVRMAGGETRVLHTRGARTQSIEPDWRTRLLAVITDPTIAYLLLLLGIYGIYFELMSPGFGVSGVTGVIALLLGMFALQLLPVNYAGVALIVLGFAMLVAEAFMPSFGALGIGGVIAFVVGSVMLIDTEAPGLGIPLPLIGTVALLNVAFVAVVFRLAWKTRGRPVVSGSEQLIGATGEVLDADAGELWVRVLGERWRARSAVPLAPGQRVRVTARDGLVLQVEGMP